MATGRPYLLVCTEESQGMALPWELRSKLPNGAVCSTAGWSSWHRGGTQSCQLLSQGPSTHAKILTGAKGRHIPPVLELRGRTRAALLPATLTSAAAGMPAGHRAEPLWLELGAQGWAPSTAPRCCPPILSRQLPPAPTILQSWLCTRFLLCSPASPLPRRLCRQLGGRKTPFCSSHTLHNRP